MPDRRRGYVRRGEGILPCNPKMAEFYRRDAKHGEVVFTSEVQRVLVAAARALCQQKGWRLHQVMTDKTHVHTLLSWRGFLEWRSVRRSLKYRFTSELNGMLGNEHPWFSEAGSRKRVRDRKHYDHLMDEYLSKHDGVYWREDGRTREECLAMIREKKRKTGDQNHRL